MEVESQKLTVVREETDNGAKAITTVRKGTIFSRVKLLVVVVVLLQMVMIVLGVYLVRGQREIVNLLSRVTGAQGSRNDPPANRTSSPGISNTNRQSGQPGQEVAQGDDYVQTIARLYSPDKNVRMSAIADLSQSGIVQDRFVPIALEFAKTHQENANGLENTLLILQRAKPDTLKRYSSELLAFVDSVPVRNKRILDQANNLRKRVNQH
jgi:hypothetical protein